MSLTISDLLDKTPDFQNLTQKEQVKLMCFFFCIENQVEIFSTAQIRNCFVFHCLQQPSNVSNEFLKLRQEKPPIIVNKGADYTLERNAKKQLEGIYLGNQHTQVVSSTLRSLLVKLKSKEQQLF